MQEPVVLLLAAGLGTRLQPLTNFLPKCLVPVQGYPVLFYWLEQIKSLGIRDCYINLHHHAELVRQVIESSPYQGWVKYIDEPELFGTAGTVRALYPEIQGRSLWLIHADNLSAATWPEFLKAFDEQCGQDDMLMHTFITDHPQSCGVLVVDPRNRVTEFHEKVAQPPSNLANGAVYLLSSDIVRRIANDSTINDFSTDLVPRLIGNIVAWHTDGYHRDIGRWPAYLVAQHEFSVSWQPENSVKWLQLWQDKELLANWNSALEDASKAETGKNNQHWQVVNCWPPQEELKMGSNTLVVSFPLKHCLDELKVIKEHTIVLSRS